MSRPRRIKESKNPLIPPGGGRRLFLPAVIVAAGIIAVAGGFWCHADSPPASATESPTTLDQRFEKLKGRWLRPDGGYIIEILNVAANGKMDVAYFNPRQINVEEAEASQNGESIKVFIKLRDVNYPGSTYTLTYDQVNNQLNGIYFQAAIKQKFDVSFSRITP